MVYIVYKLINLLKLLLCVVNQLVKHLYFL
nr:MAG TPA: hypothetical protein [Caudoviricetes sp.]